MSLKITKIFQIEKETQKPGIKMKKQSKYFRIYWSSIEKIWCNNTLPQNNGNVTTSGRMRQEGYTEQ